MTRLRRLIAGLGVLSVLAVAALLGLESWRERQRELEAVYAQLEADGRLLAEHAQLSFAASDLLLTQVSEQIRSDGLDALLQDESYQAALLSTIRSAPQLAGMVIIDAAGIVRFSSVSGLDGGVDLSDREYFQVLRGGTRTYIGSPIIGRESARPLIPVTARIDGPQGGFDGAISVTLDQAYFAAFYETVREHNRLRIGMARSDGVVLSHDPLPPAGGFPRPVEKAIAEILSGAEARTMVRASPLDGQRMVFSYRQLERYPVAVWVSYPYETFLQTLYPAFLRNAVILTVFALAAAASVLIILRQTRAVEAARAAQERLTGELRTQLDQTRRAVAAREEILRVVSHDLRSPLTAVIAGAQVAARAAGKNPSAVVRQLDAIDRAGRRMQRLIEDLLDYGSIESGRLALRRVAVDPVTIAGEALDNAREVARERGVELEADLPPRLPVVDADHDRVLQVFSNLLANALKVTPRGGTVKVGAEERGRDVCFCVCDTGPGIAAEELPRLFDRYWRSRQPGYRGTGLGLAITKGLVEAHGGRIWAESTVGRGSTFYFTIRARDDE